MGEQRHVLPAVKERLELGGWFAIHVRQQGGLTGRAHEGVIESVPASASYGWPDIFAVSYREHTPLALELKDQKRPLTGHQEDWLNRLDEAGVECAVLRPEDVFGTGARAVNKRLIEHRGCPKRCNGKDPRCTGWCRMRWPLS